MKYYIICTDDANSDVVTYIEDTTHSRYSSSFLTNDVSKAVVFNNEKSAIDYMQAGLFATSTCDIIISEKELIARLL
jgi:hypothetical protein